MANTLWVSRRFWMTVLDTVVSLTLYFLGLYAPQYSDQAKTVIVAIQPIFIALIISYTVETNAAIKAGTHPLYQNAPPTWHE